MSEPRRFAHVPALDGLRGLSVIGPLLFHARRSALPGGFLTIDVFFVLSSYLITSIVLNEWDRTNKLDVSAYAGRRARRLLPALYLAAAVLGATLAVGWHSSEVSRWTGGIVAALAYVANWHEIVVKVSYFEQFSDPSPLYHTWSLAIEEQFYVLVPIVVIAARKWLPRRGTMVLGVGAGVAAVGSAVWMAHLYTGGDPSRVYYGTDTRAQGLLVGIVLAVAVNLWGPIRTTTGRRVSLAMAYGGAAYLLWAVRSQTQSTTWLFERGGFLVLAVAAAAVIVGACQVSTGPLHRLLEASPTRALGRITYGVYLFHWPIFLLIITPRRLAASPWWTVVAFALTLAVATVSYRVIERPIMLRQWPLSGQRAASMRLATAGGAMLVLIASMLVVAEARAPEPANLGPKPIPAFTGDPTSSGVAGAPTGVTDPSAIERPTRVLVIGDSLMLLVGIALESYAETHPDELIVYTHAQLGCPIVRGGETRDAEGGINQMKLECTSWGDRWPSNPPPDSRLSYADVVETFRPDVVLGLATPWDVNDRRFNGGAWQHIGQSDYDALVVEEYRAATELLGSTGAQVRWLLGPHLNRPIVPANDPERIDRLNVLVQQAIAPIANAGTVDYPSWLGPVGSDRELRLRSDGVHLSEVGLDEATTWLTSDVIPAVIGH